MIKKLRLKFIFLSVFSLLLLLAVIITGINLINYRSVVSEADEILDLLSGNKGKFPEAGNAPSDIPSNMPAGKPDIGSKPTHGRLPQQMSPELPYESRYFSVLFSSDGKVLQIDIAKIASVDDSRAESFAKDALSGNSDKGFIGQYRYIRRAESETGTIRVTFLDCGRSLDSFKTFLYSSLLIAFAGFLLISAVICVLSSRITRPIAESYEKQKRFITDAGHEIKTPLTIINANVDVLEMEYGENESLTDIHQQTSRLTNLTNRLVALSRLEESKKRLEMCFESLSRIVKETSEPFGTLAKNQKKALLCDIQDDIILCCNEIEIGELVSILLDNAVKYSPEWSSVSLKLAKQGRFAVLSVSNKTLHPIESKELDRVFDRFYRTDPSRNSKTGGYGIGLSIAQAIVKAHNGKISVSSGSGSDFKITAVLPL